MKKLGHFIGGRWRLDGDGEVADVDPSAPASVLATFAGATEALALEAVDCALAAFPGWAGTHAHKRAKVLEATAGRLRAQAPELGSQIAREQGKTLAEATGEVTRAADVFRYFASEADRPFGEIFFSSRPRETIEVIRQPVGPVAVITPWNFPMFIPAFKIAPALVYGNTVVWKPASLTPIAARLLVDILVEAGMPPGVLNLVLAEGAAAQALVEHPDIAAVSFTGSTATGRHLAEVAARSGKDFHAEMGGKNAAVVLADADLDRAAAEVVKGAMAMAGQKCTATSRAIIETSVYLPFMDQLTKRVKEIQPGPPLQAGTGMGPLASATQRANVRQYVDDARERGASVLVGGKPYADGPLAHGFFFPPTVVETTPEDRIWQEEVFGPVLAVHPVDSPEAAFELANRTVYGLSGAVFTSSLELAREAVQRIDVGMLHINSETTGADPHVPFGGIKSSGGHFRELGPAAREFYTRLKTVYIQP